MHTIEQEAIIDCMNKHVQKEAIITQVTENDKSFLSLQVPRLQIELISSEGNVDCVICFKVEFKNLKGLTLHPNVPNSLTILLLFLDEVFH